jgi:hypothetical protein
VVLLRVQIARVASYESDQIIHDVRVTCLRSMCYAAVGVFFSLLCVASCLECHAVTAHRQCRVWVHMGAPFYTLHGVPDGDAHATSIWRMHRSAAFNRILAV